MLPPHSRLEAGATGGLAVPVPAAPDQRDSLSSSEPQVRMAGAGKYLPARAVDNYALYELDSIRDAFDVERARGSLRGTDEAEAAGLDSAEVFHRWALQVTGIARRRIFDESRDISTEWMCAEACRTALGEAGMVASDVDVIVAASITAREIVPNLACTVADFLGIPTVGGYVLNAACAGFVHAMAAGYALVGSGSAGNVLVVSGDSLCKVTNFADPTTAVLFGDGAGAVVLSADRGQGRVLGPPLMVADYSPTHLNLPGQNWQPPGSPDPTISMAGGPHVLRQAIKAMLDVAEGALARAGTTWEEVDFAIPHQANRRITQGIQKALTSSGVRVIDTIEEYGNVSASTVAITLAELLRGDHGPLPETSRIVLTAVGGGYASSAAVLEWRAAGGSA